MPSPQIIDKCPRCGEEHKDAIFKRLEKSILGWHFWSICPILDEPILGRWVPRDNGDVNDIIAPTPAEVTPESR